METTAVGDSFNGHNIYFVQLLIWLIRESLGNVHWVYIYIFSIEMISIA